MTRVTEVKSTLQTPKIIPHISYNTVVQAANCCRNSRLVVDEDDLMWVKK